MHQNEVRQGVIPLRDYSTEGSGFCQGYPSQVCSQCGEVSYGHAVVKKIEKIAYGLRSAMTEVAIVHYDRVA
jgi:hypothetical protein